MARISYSQFSQWVQCPHKWKLQYIDGYGQFKGNIYTIFGSAIHECIQLYLRVMYAESIKKANELPLDEFLMDEMKKQYLETKESLEEGEVLSSAEELKEFYFQGVQILDYFKKKRASYFSKKGYSLAGIERPLNYKLPKNLNFVGFIDVIIRDEIRDRLKIIDIKTSTMGWNKYQKADKNKTNQLLLYKHFFAKQRDISVDKIDIEYLILKRKLYENLQYPQKRIQTFSPASGKPSVNKVMKRLQEFMDDCFDESGNQILKEYTKIASTKNCKYCEFKDKPDLCDRNMK